jgi:hypothetical protein
MGARQARHLLAPARSHIRLAPSYLPGHSSPAGYPDAPRPSVLPEDGVYLPQSPGYREVPAIQILCPAWWVGSKLDPDQARNGRRRQWAEHGGWARPGNPGTEYLKQRRNARYAADRASSRIALTRPSHPGRFRGDALCTVHQPAPGGCGRSWPSMGGRATSSSGRLPRTQPDCWPSTRRRRLDVVDGARASRSRQKARRAWPQTRGTVPGAPAGSRKARG